MKASSAATLAALSSFSLLFPTAALAAPQTAAPPSAEARSGELIVVTASRQPGRVDEALADISVITRAQIEAAGPVSLTELLAREPGLQFFANGGAGKTSGLFIRGTSPAQSLVLIDGQRFGSVTSGGAALEQLALDQIERIEILRGPASALYGSDAVGGVVQIFTRQGKGPFKADAFVGGGRYGTQQYQAGIAGAEGGLSYSLRASYDQTEGFSAINDPLKLPDQYDPDLDGYRRHAVSARLGWQIAQGHELDLALQHHEGRSRYDTRDFMTMQAYDAYTDTREQGYSLSLRDRLGEAWQSTLRAGRTLDLARDYAPWNPQGASFQSQQDQFAWQNDLNFGAHQLLLGTEAVRQYAEAEGLYDVQRDILGLFAGWSGRFGAHRLQANMRRDDNSDFGAHTTAGLAWAWQFTPQWRARLSGGSSFRAPSFNDLYYPGYSNPALKAEQGRSMDGAVHWEGEDANASLTAYRNRVRDMIALDQNWVPQNIARAQLDGLTFAARLEPGAWSVGGSVDWLDARDADSDKRLIRRANWQSAVDASYGSTQWRSGAEFKWVGERYDDANNTRRLQAYQLVNLFAHWKLSPLVQLEARIDNLFDADYETAWGYGVAGVSVFAGLRVNSR